MTISEDHFVADDSTNLVVRFVALPDGRCVQELAFSKGTSHPGMNEHPATQRGVAPTSTIPADVWTCGSTTAAADLRAEIRAEMEAYFKAAAEREAAEADAAACAKDEQPYSTEKGRCPF